MPESTIPLLVGNTIESVDSNYMEIIKVEADPNEHIYIGDIRIDIDDTTTKPHIKISINGSSYLKDHALINATTTFSFGRDLKLKNNKAPLVVEIKKTTGTLKATCVITGIRQPIK